MSALPVCFRNIRLYTFVLGLNILFTVVHTSENGILPHFKVDHQAGKLKITADKNSADITYKNDNVDLVVKPNNKEQAKVIINSMKDNELAAKRDSAPEDSDLLRGTTKEEHVLSDFIESEKSIQPRTTESIGDKSRPQKIHLDISDNDIGIRRSKINKHNDDDDENDDHKDMDGSDVTWRGRINHVSEDHPPDNSHVLSALSEIKNLMTLSMKPPNLKAFDEVLPDSSDKYLHAADTVIKKLEHAQEKKRQTEETQDNRYIHKVKNMIHENLQNNTYTDDPADLSYVQKAHEIIQQEHHKGCTGAHCRHHIHDEHPHKGCVGAHCRHEMYLSKEDPRTDSSFEDEFIGKLKEHTGHELPNAYHNQDTDYENNEDDDFQTSHRKSHNQHPYDTTDYHNAHITPYHSQEDESALLDGEDNHHDPLEMEHIDIGHGAHNRHIADDPDRAFEKEFENKINEKEYGVNTDEVAHNLPHAHPLHSEPLDNHNGDGYLGGGEHDYDHVGSFHPHGKNEYDLSPYHHGGELTELPDMPEHRVPEHHSGPHHGFNSDDGEGESHSRDHEHANYDFDETKEVKDEEHDAPDMVNGKLKDWYKLNALGVNPSASLDEPIEGDIVVAQNENVKSETEVKSPENKTSSEDKKIESKFEEAGEKPLNSSEAEEAIKKLNESLASGLNESTIKAISNYDNATDLNDLNKTAADALNSFNTIKFETLNNDTVNAEKMLKDDDQGSHLNATRSMDLKLDVLNSTDKNTSGHQNAHQNDLKKKIGNIEKKINSSGDLMKKLEDLEKKMNSTDKQSRKHNTTINLSKQLSSTEKELLRVSHEDVLQTHQPDDDDLKILHHKEQNNGSMRTLNVTAAPDSEKNETLNNSTSEVSNENKTDGIENIYASIGEPGELSGEASKSNLTADNKTNTDVGGSGESAQTHPLVEDKHAEQKNLNEKAFDDKFLKHHKTKVSEIGGEKFGLLKRHKTKGYQNRRGRIGLKRHKTKERNGFKRHKTKVYGRF